MKGGREGFLNKGHLHVKRPQDGQKVAGEVLRCAGEDGQEGSAENRRKAREPT